VILTLENKGASSPQLYRLDHPRESRPQLLKIWCRRHENEIAKRAIAILKRNNPIALAFTAIAGRILAFHAPPRASTRRRMRARVGNQAGVVVRNFRNQRIQSG
jgi:hypothetical protein